MDIVERLRTRPTGDPYLHDALVKAFYRIQYEAADEIERLRAELSARKCVVTGCGMYDADEIDQLRAELASWQEAFGLLTTLHGSMQIDVSDPLRMAKSIEVHVRAELAVLRGRIADDAALVSEYTLLLRDAYNLCNPAWPWMHGLRERIRAALGAKEEW